MLQLQSKRELFFKNELPSTNSSTTNSPVTASAVGSTPTPTKPDILNGNAPVITNSNNSNSNAVTNSTQPPVSSNSVYNSNNKENYAKKPDRSE